MNSTEQFEAIVSEHYEALFRFAMSLTREEADARDLTQQTFYVWATKGHQLRDLSKVKTWLFTTLHRSFLVVRRRQTRFVHVELEEAAGHLPPVVPARYAASDSSEVLRALARLDEVYQAAVALFYLEDCSYKEIAAILEVPMGTVKSRIARGVLQLRKTLLAGDPVAEEEDAMSLPPARVQLTDGIAGGGSGTIVPFAAGNESAPQASDDERRFENDAAENK